MLKSHPESVYHPLLQQQPYYDCEGCIYMTYTFLDITWMMRDYEMNGDNRRPRIQDEALRVSMSSSKIEK